MRMGAAHDCDSFSACESVPPVRPRPLRCSTGGPVTNSRLCSALRRIAKGGPPRTSVMWNRQRAPCRSPLLISHQTAGGKDVCEAGGGAGGLTTGPN
jgi:hypothetical protein